MSALFSQLVSLVTPKYSKVNTQESEYHHHNIMQKNHFRATLSAEDRAKFFPEAASHPPITTSTSDKRYVAQTPPPPSGFKTENLWDVDLNDEETDEYIYKTQDDAKTNEKVIDEQEIIEKVNECDNMVMQTDKTRPQIGDIFPTINEILHDHSIKEKLKDLTITVKNKLQKDEVTPDEAKETKEGNIFNGISLPQPPSFLTRNPGSEKLYPLQQSKDKTVQTYFPGH